MISLIFKLRAVTNNGKVLRDKRKVNYLQTRGAVESEKVDDKFTILAKNIKVLATC